MITTVIFDMDGVIFDSERVIFEEWKLIAEKYHLENFEEMYSDCLGSTAARVKEIFLSFYGEDIPYDKYRDERSENYHKKYDGGNLPLKPGIKELLTYLKEKKYNIIVASSTRSAVVKKQIEDARLSKYFDKIYGGEIAKRSKPFPDIFLESVKDIEPDAGKCLVIEDSYNGIRAAKAAGMTAVMIPDMKQPNEEMKNLADYIFETLLDVKSIL